MTVEKDFALRFPIGEDKVPEEFQEALIRSNIDAIARLPSDLIRLVRPADKKLLRASYRPGGWTALQVLHHIADSHVNSYCRFKLALTEDNPTIKPYDENAWAGLADYREEMVDPALGLIDSLHAKWVCLLSSLTEGEWRRTFYHPGSGKQISLFQNVATYAWHGRHHLRHIEIALGK